MKRLIICFLMSSLVFSIYAQEEDFSWYIRQGIELHDRGYYDAAIRCYEEITQLYPESLLPYFYMAQSYAYLNQPADSQKCTDKAIMLDMGREPTDKRTFYLEALEHYVILIISVRSLEPEITDDE